MGRILTILLVAAVLGGAVLTYDSKHRGELAVERVASLKNEIDGERSSISMLRAEWSVLTQPSRLQGLTERFKTELNLAPAEVTQIVTINDVPLKPPGPTIDSILKPITTASASRTLR